MLLPLPPVALDPGLTSAAWSMTETWTAAQLQSVSHEYGNGSSATCPPRDDSPCSSGQWATYAKPDDEAPYFAISSANEEGWSSGRSNAIEFAGHN